MIEKMSVYLMLCLLLAYPARLCVLAQERAACSTVHVLCGAVVFYGNAGTDCWCGYQVLCLHLSTIPTDFVERTVYRPALPNAPPDMGIGLGTWVPPAE